MEENLYGLESACLDVPEIADAAAVPLADEIKGDVTTLANAAIVEEIRKMVQE